MNKKSTSKNKDIDKKAQKKDNRAANITERRGNIDALKNQPERFINRELSWLAFNQRVLDESQNPNHPLFERLRFLSIAASNQDEFVMVRVAGIKGQIAAEISRRSTDGLSPQQQLNAISQRSASLISDMQNHWHKLNAELSENGINIVKPKNLTKSEKLWAVTNFEEDIFPILSPMAVDPAHPFPFIPNRGLAIALQIHNKQKNQDYEALLTLPTQIKRFIRLPDKTANAPIRYILLEDLIMMNIEQIFPEPLNIKDHALFRILRDSEIEIDDEASDLVLNYESALKRRRRGNVIGLTVSDTASEELMDFLVHQFRVAENDIYKINGLAGLADISALITDDKRDLLFPPFDPRFPERIRDFGGDCFAAIQHKDIIVHHPYESFDVVVQFLRQAARDPNVEVIKQTLYRTSADSTIVEALIEAAENGKSVTAMVELKARFDEEANIRWARDMERAGIQVVYGFVDLKTHTKLSLVHRREGEKLRSYAHFGTGNYHPQNARVYTDLSYFTCDKALCQDAAKLFNFMTGYAAPAKLESLSTAPLNLRSELSALIDQEISYAQEGKPAQIWGKCNALLDEKIIDKLYEASQAGVQIDFIVRGICALRPGIPGLSENIRIKSIVGRYLEHSRIYCFGNGQNLPSNEAKVFISSADIMKRNLDHRIEVLVPITNPTVHKQVLDQIMVANLKDKKQSWIMNPDGNYDRLSHNQDDFGAHDYFMTNPSLSGRGKALVDAPMPPRLSLDRRRRGGTGKKK